MRRNGVSPVGEWVPLKSLRTFGPSALSLPWRLYQIQRALSTIWSIETIRFWAAGLFELRWNEAKNTSSVSWWPESECHLLNLLVACLWSLPGHSSISKLGSGWSIPLLPGRRWLLLLRSPSRGTRSLLPSAWIGWGFVRG